MRPWWVCLRWLASARRLEWRRPGLTWVALTACVVLGGCTVSGPAAARDGGKSVLDGPSGKLSFAVFGDARPGNLDDTANYPSAVVQGIFKLAAQRGAAFVVGTGDYMFASKQETVDAQLQLFASARAAFPGPVYLTMGNHECNGYTSSNCPNLNETANVTGFLKQLPPGVARPFYRINVDTPSGKAKLVFVAANAWNDAQSVWLKTQLADPTTYTFVVRHEPTPRYASDTAPGVAPSEALVNAAPLTLMLLGHSHEYLHFDSRHVISGNAGAPLQIAGDSYGFLLVEQQDDGSLQASEIDEATNNVVDSWRIDAHGDAL